MSETIDFIILDSLVGQYTIHYPVSMRDSLSFILIKQECVPKSWDLIKNDPKCYIPCLSVNQDPDDEQIDEYLPLSRYNLQNGGVIFLHYCALDIKVE